MTQTLTPTAAAEIIEQSRAASVLAWGATYEPMTGPDADVVRGIAEACDDAYLRVLDLLEGCYGDYRTICERLLTDIARHEREYGDDQHAMRAIAALAALEADDL